MQANPCGLPGDTARETRLHAAVRTAQRSGTASGLFLSDLKVRPPKQRGKRERRKLDYMLQMRQRRGRALRADRSCRTSLRLRSGQGSPAGSSGIPEMRNPALPPNSFVRSPDIIPPCGVWGTASYPKSYFRGGDPSSACGGLRARRGPACPPRRAGREWFGAGCAEMFPLLLLHSEAKGVR